MTRIDVARKPITFIHCDERWPVFAPSAELLHEYKGGWISWDEYVQRYYEEMRAAYRRDATPFREMARRLHDVTFVCWCSQSRPSDHRCHRFLLVAILRKVADAR